LVNGEKPAVAIFGGSFDPPHTGHQAIVRKALEVLDIDTLLVVPAYLNPFKQTSLADASVRLQWCRALFDSIPNVHVDDYEIRQGRSTTTVESVKHFQKRYDVKYLIIGSDNLSTLTQWHAFEWLNSHIIWVIATRKGHKIETGALKRWKILEIDADVSSTQIRQSGTLEHVDTRISETVKKILKGQPS